MTTTPARNSKLARTLRLIRAGRREEGSSLVEMASFRSRTGSMSTTTSAMLLTRPHATQPYAAPIHA
jgi:hypothetical protein